MDLRAERRPDGEGWELLSPGAGFYARAPRAGSFLRAGDAAGVLVVLGKVYELTLPEGVSGFVASEPPERKHLPVGYRVPLLQLHDAGDEGAAGADPPDESARGSVVRSPQPGRFYRRPDPDSPPFVQEGDALSEGRTLGLLEVMKTFHPVKYRPGGGLPVEGRVVRVLAQDGDDVEEGQPLLEVE